MITHTPCNCFSTHDNFPQGHCGMNVDNDDPFVRAHSCDTCGRLWIRILFEGYHTNSATFYAAHAEPEALENFSIDRIDEIFLASDRVFIGGYDNGDRIQVYDGGFPVDPWYGFRAKERVEKARSFAIEAHGNQKYGVHPYEFHLNWVNQVMMRHPIASSNIFVVMAGWLHDVLEDTEVSREELKNQFGERTTDIVFRVSDEPGENRKERKEKTYRKIRGHIYATVVKLCDRIANVEASQNNPKKLNMYKEEYPEFKRQLCIQEHTFMNSMWGELDELISD